MFMGMSANAYWPARHRPELLGDEVREVREACAAAAAGLGSLAEKVQAYHARLEECVDLVEE